MTTTTYDTIINREFILILEGFDDYSIRL